MNFTTQMHRMGVLFEVEIEYEVIPSDDRTGWPEMVEVTEMYVVGFYPENDNNRREYVPIGAKARLNCFTQAEDLYFIKLCEEHLDQCRKEAEYEI